jgi:adenosine kinase
MLCDRTGESLHDISMRPNIEGIFVTLADQGCEVWRRGARTAVPGTRAQAVVDPTGCGDAFRAGLLYALERGWPLERAAALGNRLGALKIAHRGGQNHRFERAEVLD